MSAINDRPILMALSNPTANAECTAADAYEWSGGRAIFASGSPFAPVEYGGRTLVPSQANNAYIFPGVAMGAIASGASRVTDEMFLVAARVLADTATDTDIARGSLFPPLDRIREISATIATAVAALAYQRRLTPDPRPARLRADIEALMYEPNY
jgi:malate dehydrogenase (oxaloacetate-decarboxylating)(NADP+)